MKLFIMTLYTAAHPPPRHFGVIERIKYVLNLLSIIRTDYIFTPRSHKKLNYSEEQHFVLFKKKKNHFWTKYFDFRHVQILNDFRIVIIKYFFYWPLMYTRRKLFCRHHRMVFSLTSIHSFLIHQSSSRPHPTVFSRYAPEACLFLFGFELIY